MSALQKHLIRLWAGDMDRLRAIYHTKTPNSVIRDLVRNHLDRVEAKNEEALKLKEEQDV